ncbi:MAG: DUF1176 domain-containing protein [Azoarcus sp.]|jgi:hypothetical protein|nr:DUF1176 domain-containing protein [Azoarcus sp.]
MNYAGWKFVLALLALCASFTAAGEAPGVYFSHEVWEIVCDNTRTCRMAGYCAEGNYDEGCGSVLITRAAGPDTLLEGELTLADYESIYEWPHVLTLYIDGKVKGKLNIRENESLYPLTPTQIQALLAAARSDRTIKFEGDSISFTLSGKGVSAVMLKMDEFQGRIGTPGALIRKGEKPEESVLSPLPVPVIRAAKVSNAPPRALTAPEVAALKPLLLQSKGKNANEEECEFEDTDPTEVSDFTLTPLDERHVLISTRCRLYARDETVAFWVMDSALKGIPKFVMIETGEYQKGIIYGVFRSNCPVISRWVWDGREFRPSAGGHSGMCRNIPIHRGGTWSLPTFVTKIINADGSPRNSD